MNCQSMSTVPCFKSSTDLLLLLDLQVELVVLFVYIPFKLVDVASSTPVHQLLL